MESEVARVDLRSRRKSLVGYAVGLGLYTLVIVALYPAFKDSSSLDKILKESPSIAALFGISGSITSPDGWTNANLYANFLPLIVLLLTIGYGASAIAGEEEAGRLDLIVSLPLGRRRIVAEKSAVMLVQAGVVCVVTYGCMLVGRAFDLRLDAWNLATTTLGVLLLGVSFGCVALAIGAARRTRTRARHHHRARISGVSRQLARSRRLLAGQLARALPLLLGHRQRPTQSRSRMGRSARTRRDHYCCRHGGSHLLRTPRSPGLTPRQETDRPPAVSSTLGGELTKGSSRRSGTLRASARFAGGSASHVHAAGRLGNDMGMRTRTLGCLLVIGLGVVTSSAAVATVATDPKTTATAPLSPVVPTWTQVTDDTGRNVDEVGLARTDDGVVHVLWRERLGPLQEQITHTPINDGQLGASSVASGPWASAGNPAVVVTADGALRILFPGLTGTDHTRDGMQSASSDSTGAQWSTVPTRVSATESAIGEGVGAAVAPDGTPVFAFAYTFVLGLHSGLNPADPDVNLLPGTACCAYWPGVVYDSTGKGFIGWYSNVKGDEGLWVQEIGPPLGPKILLPGSVTDGKILAISQQMPIAVRPHQPGVWAAYCSGYPRCTKVWLWRQDTATPITVAEGTDVEAVNIAAEPDGRLWVMWEDAQDRTLHAVRTSPDASVIGGEVTFAAPVGTRTVWKLKGIAGDDGLDVFTSVATPGADAATWHAEILPGLTVEKTGKKKQVVLEVTDAGRPVKGAVVRVGRRSLKTNKKGRTKAARLKGTAEVTKSGYSPTHFVIS